MSGSNLLAAIILFYFVILKPFGLRAQKEKADLAKPPIIVTTDITSEPDDQESLIRLLLYANDIDIEGLIASTGIWKLSDPATNVIHECIDGYAKVYNNLLFHDKAYPTADYLHNITATGNRGYGMSHVSERGSEGSRLIMEEADKDDPRPLRLFAWGGANTIAQAIWTVRDNGKPSLTRYRRIVLRAKSK